MVQRPHSKSDLDQIRNHDIRRRAQALAYENADYGVADRLRRLAKTYPGMSPGTAYSLAQSGFGPSETAEKLWQLELRSNTQRMPGQRVSGRHNRVTEDVEVESSKLKLKRLLDPEKAVERFNDLMDENRDVPQGMPGLVTSDTFEKLTRDHPKVWASLPEKTRKRLVKQYYDPEQGKNDPGLIGGATQLATKALTPVTHEVDTDIPVLSQVQEGGKALIRGTGTVAQAGQESVAGIIRQYADPSKLFGPDPMAPQEVVEQTTLYQATRRGGILGAATETGTGYIPDPRSKAAQAAAEAARRYSPYLIGGHAWTPGRALADTFSEPEDDLFKIASGTVDLTVALKADPASAFLNVTSMARRSKELIVADNVFDQGLVVAQRDGFVPVKWSEHSLSPAVQRKFEDMAAEPSAFEVHRNTGLPYYNAKGDEVAGRVARAKTADEVAAIYEENLKEVGKPQWAPASRSFQRWRTDLPGIGKPIQVGADTDLNEFASQIDRWLVNLNADYAVRKQFGDEIATVGNDALKQRKVVDTFLRAYGEGLRAYGAPDDLIQDGVKFMRKEYFDDLAYNHSMTEDTSLFNPSGVAVGDTQLHLTDADGFPLMPEDVQQGMRIGKLGDSMLEEQLFHNVVYLPNPRDVRHAVSKYNKFARHPLYQNASDLADMGMNLWKQVTLARIATGLRITGEEQFRLAAYGLASLTRHPMTAASFIIGNPDSRWIERAYRISEENPSLLPFTIAADAFKKKVGRTPSKLYQPHGIQLNPLADALYRRYEAVEGSQRVFLGGFHNVNVLNPNAEHARLIPEGLGDTIMRMREDDLAMAIVFADDLNDVKEAFRNGSLKHYRDYIASYPQKHAVGYDDIAADAVVDDYAASIKRLTGGNRELQEALRTGSIRGRRIYDGRGNVRQAARSEFERIITEGRDARLRLNSGELTQEQIDELTPHNIPDEVAVPRERGFTDAQNRRVLRRLDNGLNYLLDAFLTRPSNYFSRNLMTQQVFLSSMEEAFPYIDNAGRKKILGYMDDANLSKKTKERFRYMDSRLTRIEEASAGPQKFKSAAEYEAQRLAGMKPLPKEHTLTYEEAGEIAARRAINETKEVLYDLSRRNQGMDMLRLLFPFGEAYKEVTTRWMKLIWGNKAVLRRLEQGIYAARESGSSAIYSAVGIPDTPVDVTDPTQGIQGLWQKDQFGNEVFLYPGSNLITEKLFGVPVPLKGSVQGLNLVGNGIPGVGPMIQFPAAWLLSNKPSTDGIRKMIFPVGPPEVSDIFPGFVGKGWKAIFGNPNTDRIFGATVADVAKYLASTKDYDLHGPNAQEEMSRLMDDATKGARGVYMIRAMGQYSLPSAPSPQWLVHDKKGRLTMLWAMADWYHKKAEDPNIGYDEAFRMFLDKFGTRNWFTPQPKTAAITPNAPLSTDEYAWARENPDLKKKFPKTYGLWAPPDGDGDLDSYAYEAQFESGERVALTPEKMLRLAHHRLANMSYNDFKIQFGNSISQSEEILLREYRTQLVREFPGYKDDPINFTRKDVLIAELERAVDEDTLRRNPIMRPLREYLENRAALLLSVQRKGVGSFKAQAATTESIALWSLGEELVDKYPSFQRMWDSVFKGELQTVDTTLGTIDNG